MTSTESSMHGDMPNETNQQAGWTPAMEHIYYDFSVHKDLLLLMYRLNILNASQMYTFQQCFEQHTWNLVRNDRWFR